MSSNCYVYDFSAQLPPWGHWDFVAHCIKCWWMTLEFDPRLQYVCVSEAVRNSCVARNIIKRLTFPFGNSFVIYVWLETFCPLRVFLSTVLLSCKGLTDDRVKTGLSLPQYWTDVYLSWNPERYPGVQNLRFPSDQIWTPDILLYNRSGDAPSFLIPITCFGVGALLRMNFS